VSCARIELLRRSTPNRIAKVFFQCICMTARNLPQNYATLTAKPKKI
jgi:hypothetical protein